MGWDKENNNNKKHTHREREIDGTKITHPNQFIVLRLYPNDNISQDNKPCNMFYVTYNNEQSFRAINKINIFIHVVLSFYKPLYCVDVFAMHFLTIFSRYNFLAHCRITWSVSWIKMFNHTFRSEGGQNAKSWNYIQKFIFSTFNITHSSP